MLVKAIQTVAAFLACLWIVAGHAGELQVGAASVKITPPLGVPMAGYYAERFAEGVHDDLYAKSIILEKDGVKAVFVSLDLISTKRDFVEGARKGIEREVRIPASHVMISATHAHTGPILSGRSKRSDAIGGDSSIAEAFTASLPSLIARSVQEADGNLVPAKAAVGLGREAELSFNRRFHMKDGTVGWNPGRLNPNIIRPVGPIDPDVPVVHFESQQREPIATYVNFTMHLDTVGGLQISADYPYTLYRLLGEFKGQDMVTLFTIGAAGDINHINVKWANPQKGHGEAARIGTILAAEALKTFEHFEILDPQCLAARSEIVELPLPELEPGEVGKAREVAARHKDGKSPQPTFLEAVKAYQVLDVADRGGKPLEAEVQVISLGQDVAWVALPGEIFVEIGLAIKAASPFEYTIIAQLANGSVGYVPTKRAYPEGNYEVVSARCAEGSGEMLVNTALRLLRELYAAPH